MLLCYYVTMLFCRDDQEAGQFPEFGEEARAADGRVEPCGADVGRGAQVSRQVPRPSACEALQGLPRVPHLARLAAHIPHKGKIRNPQPRRYWHSRRLARNVMA